jgi:hypothetical protein
MDYRLLLYIKKIIATLLIALTTTGCAKENIVAYEPSTSGNPLPQTPGTGALLLIIDEDCIDNGTQPNNFSDVDVNDHLATVGLRQPLSWFRSHAGKVINLYTGDVGDEGLHAVTAIPASWKIAGPTANGARNFLQAGPGLGSGINNTEVLLDKIPGITPLRATGLTMLTGNTILAVVYDADAAINYNPLNTSLMGATLGLVAFEVISVQKRTDGSNSSLPSITVRIVTVESASALPLRLFSNPPIPISSSEPFDVNLPATIPSLTTATAP